MECNSRKGNRKATKYHSFSYTLSLKLKTAKLPTNSLILNDFGKVDYCDTFRTNQKGDESIDRITTEIFSVPAWVERLMQIRNRIVRFFGLRTGSTKDTNIKEYYPIGSRAVFFTVINRNEHEIVLSENDKHLNFRVSVLKEQRNETTTVYVSTLVKYNNFWGRLYFFFVKPFHKIIVKSLVKKMSRMK